MTAAQAVNMAEPVAWQDRIVTRGDVRRELRGLGMAAELVESVVGRLPLFESPPGHTFSPMALCSAACSSR